MLIIIVTILHVIMCLTLIAIVLLQTGKGANMGAAFGGGSNTIFGGAGPASFLNKITTIAAVMFMVTSFSLAVLSSRGGTSSRVLDAPVEQTQPVEGTTTVPEGTAVPADTAAPEAETSQESDAAPVTEDSQEETQSTE